MTNTHHIVGAGPHKVVVLPGWFGDAHAFAPMEGALTGADFTYAFVDCRGYGGMMNVAGDYTMDEIAGDVLALADSLGFRQFSLIGHSMGGMAIQRVLTRAPDRAAITRCAKHPSRWRRASRNSCAASVLSRKFRR